MKIFIKEKLKKYDSQNQMNKYRFAAHKILPTEYIRANFNS